MSSATSFLSFSTVLGALGCLAVSVLVYNAFFHPLSKVPGPKLWGATRAPWIFYMFRGNLMHTVTALHEKYGPAVRVGPDEVSFVGAEAFQIIHAYRPGIKQFPKNPVWHEHAEPGCASIMNANIEDHARIRKVLNSSFTAQNLATMEPMLRFYMRKFVARLGEKAKASAPDNVINMVYLLNMVAFDIVGELTFHESFGCLDSDKLHPWIETTFSYFNAVAIIATARFFPFAERLLMASQSSKALEAQTKHFNLTTEAVDRRLKKTKFENHAEYPDFVDAFQQALASGEITKKEVDNTTINLVIGGSETIASALSGTINYLLRYPDALKRVTAEVRAAFSSADDLTIDATEKKCEYLTCVLKEGLRLAPPVPCGIPRTAPSDGAVIQGYYLPPGTQVSVHQYATNRSPDLWADADTFAPERWLEPPGGGGNPKFGHDERAAMKVFSLGPRRCLGERLAWAEMRLMLVNILYHFDLSPTGDTRGDDSKPMNHWEDQKTYMLWTREPFYVHVTPRA